MMRSQTVRNLLLTTALVAIGGGYSGGVGAEPAYPFQPSEFETPEFDASNALDLINAQAAYAAGGSGSGVIVGVIDEDFDLDHPELAPNFIDFLDLTAGNRTRQSEADDEAERQHLDLLETVGDTFLPTGHGTAVAGVIAAARDGDGIHGVAPEAGILAIHADEYDFEEIEDNDDLVEAIEEDDLFKFVVLPTDSDDPGDAEIITLSDDEDEVEDQLERLQARIADKNFVVRWADSGFYDQTLATAVDVAVAGGSRIINMSLGGGTETEQPLIDSLQTATEEGVIVVASAGNADSPNAEAPANLAVDPRTNGLMLAVAQVDENKEFVEEVNRCGSAAAQCLVALGEDVLTTENGGGLGENSGSSFSAPAVSGSLALLLDLFPTLFPEEAVQLLLTTAEDLGKEGVDEVFGHGLVDLERAVQPVGVASLPTGGDIRGKVVFLSSSKLGLSGAFGNAFAKAGAFKNGFFLDEFRRPFKADLSQQVVARDRGINFEGVLGGSDVETETFVNPDGYQVTLSLRDGGQDAAFETPLAAFGSAQDAYDRENQLQSLRLSGELAPGLEVSSGVNLTASQQLTADPASEATKGLFLFEGDAVSPQHGFLGRGNGLSLTQDLTKGTSLTLGFLTAGEQLGDRGGEGTTTQADLNHRFDNGAALGFSASFTQESEGFLGSEASGAFAARSETTSQFYTLSGSLPVTAGIEAFGSTTLGISDLSGVEGGLLSDLDRATSSAFAMGVVKKGVIDDKDRIGIRFSQPLRIEGGADATLSVPTSVNADGTINETSETVNLQPSGRELNLQLAYTRKLAETVNVTNYALARSEPGHNAEAKPDIGVGVRVNWNF